MYLTIDIGNTATKVMLSDKDTIKWFRSYKKISLADLKKIFSAAPVNYAILSSVTATGKGITDFLRTRCTFIQLNAKTKIPVKNAYKTPATLGSDRLAAVTGAAALFPGKNVLVIDAGTCIKYDFITKRKEYRGGSISPGFRMRLMALHNFTGKLPLINPAVTKNFIGTSTKDSILTGTHQGILYEMSGFISRYKKRFGTVQVVMTGGDATLFAEHIKSSIFAAPNLIHIGLREILVFHAT